MRDIFLFLGVNDSFVPDVTKKHNAGNEPVLRFKWGIIDDLFNRPNILKSAVKRFVPAEILQKTKYLMSTYNLPGGKIMQFPPMDENVRRQLQNEYKDDILKLQKLIDTDLSLWLK